MMEVRIGQTWFLDEGFGGIREVHVVGEVIRDYFVLFNPSTGHILFRGKKKVVEDYLMRHYFENGIDWLEK